MSHPIVADASAAARMSRCLHRRWRTSALAVMASTLVFSAAAQDADRKPASPSRSPEMPMEVVVPFPRGGSAEHVAGIVAQSLGQALNRRVTMRNVASGIGVGAMNDVAELAPREIRIGYVTSTQLVEATLLNKPPGYKPMSEFEWIGIIGSFGNAVVVGPQETAATFADWLRDVPRRERPQRWGVGAPSAMGTLAARYLEGALGIRVEFVTYLTADASYEALRKGQIDANFDGLPNALEEAPAAGGRILAVTSRERAAVLPSAPAFGERWPGEDFSTFAALVVSAKEGEAVRARLKSGWYGVNRAQTARQRLEAIGITYSGLDGADAVAYMEDQFLRHARLLARLSKS